jgi:hypothetical protein
MGTLLILLPLFATESTQKEQLPEIITWVVKEVYWGKSQKDQLRVWWALDSRCHHPAKSCFSL